MWWFWKNWMLTFSTLWGMWVVLKEPIIYHVSNLCGYDGLERTDFKHFLLCVDVVVLIELILNSFYFVWMWWSWKNWFLTFFTLCGCGGLERTDFNHSLFCVDVVVLKELIFYIIYFVWMWWSWEELIFIHSLYFVWISVVFKELIFNIL